jgi:hypothetical protein
VLGSGREPWILAAAPSRQANGTGLFSTMVVTNTRGATREAWVPKHRLIQLGKMVRNLGDFHYIINTH